MCHPFSSMFHHLTCLGTCWKLAPGSGCGGVGGMDGDATTPGGFERRGTFFCGGPIGPGFFLGDFNEENLWKPIWKPMKTYENLEAKERTWWISSKTDEEWAQAVQKMEHWSTNPPGFFSSTDGLGHLNLGEVWKQSAVNLLVTRCFKRNKQTNRFNQID